MRVLIDFPCRSNNVKKPKSMMFDKLKEIHFGGVRNVAGRETDIEKIFRYL